MKSYEQYKPSGVAWLGDVPEHWEVCRLKNICAIYNGATPSSTNPDYWDGEIIWVTPKDINDKKFIATSGRKITQEGFQNSGTHIVPKGSVILTTRAPIGKVTIAEQELCTNQGCKSLVINEKVQSVFLFYLLSSSSERLNTLGTGTTFMELSAIALGNIKIALPPLYEQTAIVTYLDERTAYLERLIAKQQALSEKLSEKRTALITEAVCGRFSINTDVESAFLPTLRDSGIQWLGEVPEHWETWKITHLVDFIGSGTTPKSDNPEYYDGEMLWVTTSELRENYISDTKQKVSQEAVKNFSALKIYPKNSVAIAMYGATIGRLGILEKEATFNQACCVFIPSEKLHYKFLFYWLWHRRPILISLSNGGGQPNLSQDDLKKIKIAIPNYEKQTSIAAFLDKETAKIDCLQAKIAESIARLKEYRSALITQVVTGKIKVQGV
ncbi:restriction endonuclease subunit S [Rodentibacter pneumotropicus]|uniref:restriction endonuclease subunit S n=1 Tax=Rodentibacter pneumotropicus TaxID=758 RepID=UPI00232BB612|nr:restriction endonuclease subunit S [Rodentibacter pneumotropicus]MDC2825668.1 restriction endonuclease subunit S [Rodentibacter pneumotropicus]